MQIRNRKKMEKDECSSYFLGTNFASKSMEPGCSSGFSIMEASLREMLQSHG